MAGTMQQVVAKYSADVTAYNKSMQSMKKETEDFANRAKSAISGLGSGMGALGKGVLGAVAGFGQWVFWAKQTAKAGVELARGVFDEASSWEQYQISLTKLLGSGRAAYNMLVELDHFADHTPFDFDTLVSATQKMKALGFASQDIVPTIQAVGATLYATGKGSDSLMPVVAALAKIQQTGKLTGLQMRALLSENIPAWDLLAKGMGVTVVEAQKKVQKGAVDAADALKYMRQGMMEMYGGQLAANMNSYAGSIKRLGEAWRDTMRSFMLPILPTVEKYLRQLADWAESPAWENLATVWGERIAGALDKAITLAQDTAKWFKGLFDIFRGGNTDLEKGASWWQRVGALLETLRPYVTLLVSDFADVLAIFSRLEGTAVDTLFVGLSNVLQLLAPLLPFIGDAFGQIAATFAEVAASSLNNVMRALEDILATMAPYLPPLVQSFADLASALLRAAGTAILATLRSLVALLDALLPIVLPTVTALLDFATVLVNWLEPALPVIIPLLVALGTAFLTVKAALVGVTIYNWLQSLWQVVTLLPTAIGLLVLDAQAVWANVTAWAALKATQVWTWITGIVGALPGLVTGLWASASAAAAAAGGFGALALSLLPLVATFGLVAGGVALLGYGIYTMTQDSTQQVTQLHDTMVAQMADMNLKSSESVAQMEGYITQKLMNISNMSYSDATRTANTWIEESQKMATGTNQSFDQMQQNLGDTSAEAMQLRIEMDNLRTAMIQDLNQIRNMQILDPDAWNAAKVRVMTLKSQLDDLDNSYTAPSIGLVSVNEAINRVRTLKSEVDDVSNHSGAPSIGLRSVDAAILRVMQLKNEIDDVSNHSGAPSIGTRSIDYAIGRVYALKAAIDDIPNRTVYINTVERLTQIREQGMVGGQYGQTKWRGGLIKVGEAGWEYAMLPRGTTIYDHSLSERMQRQADFFSPASRAPTYTTRTARGPAGGTPVILRIDSRDLVEALGPSLVNEIVLQIGRR